MFQIVNCFYAGGSSAVDRDFTFDKANKFKLI